MAEMNYPNLLIVGAPKSGTSSVYHYLSQHPDIFMSEHKEPHFLIANSCSQINYEPWIRSEMEYVNLFESAASHEIIGEGSVTYLTMSEAAIANIKKYLPNEPKILILLRNPIDRAISAYRHMKRSNPDEKRTFLEAVSESEEGKIFNHPLMLYKTSGLYSENVNAYLSNFKDVKILIYEDFFQNVSKGMSSLWKFLSIAPFDEIEFEKKYNVKSYSWKSQVIQKWFITPSISKRILKRALPFLSNKRVKEFIQSIFITKEKIKIEPEAIKILQEYYQEDVRNLSKILSIDLTHWIEKRTQ